MGGFYPNPAKIPKFPRPPTPKICYNSPFPNPLPPKMRLIALKLEGFKSFADPVHPAFAGGPSHDE